MKYIYFITSFFLFFFFQAEDGIRDLVRSRGLGDVYKRQVSNELIDEMKDEIKKGNYVEVSAIADDVKQNLTKINHHGKRADAIVKSMLEHSRIGTGQKEITDINVLCDECIRLAFHGLRAKDKSFNASFETHFDSTLPNIKVVPQDIGRVLLNIINNTFYAVSEKSKSVNLKAYVT